MRLKYGLMLAVLLLAALRIINIDGPALWTDEGFTYYTFKIDLFQALVGDRHPPFYFYTLHAWEAVAGDSIFALRFWSFVSSMLTVAVGFQIGRELRGNAKGVSLPVLVALMLALADAENYMAQELRMYTWHVLFAAASTLFYLRVLRLRRGCVAWVVINTLLLHTHYFGAFVLMVQGIHALIFTQGRLRVQVVAAMAATGILFLPWFLGVTIQQFADEAVCVNCATSQNVEILLDFREKWLGQMWPLTLLLLLGGVLSGRRMWLLLGLIVLPVAGTFALGHEEAVLLARRMVQITVPISVLMALGMMHLQPLARGVLAAALIVYGVTTIDWYRVKVPWHEVTMEIVPYAQPDELALIEVGFEESALLYYYDHLLPDTMQISSYPVWSDQERFDYYERELPALLATQDARQEGIVTAWVTFFSPDDGLLRKLEQAGFTRTWTRPFAHLQTTIDIYRYDRLSQMPLTTFDNGMNLLAAEIVPDDLRVDLWWVVNAPLTRDYVVSAVVLDADGRLVAQLDSPPDWRNIYDPRPLALTMGDTLPPGEYTVSVRVYGFTADGQIDPIMTVDDDHSFTVGTLAR
jgi:hypothetical protein